MKNSVYRRNTGFRSVDFWKSAVMTMPDNSFFELLRSVFGKIKTPFKKQQLVNELETFLLREDIQKVITAYIDETDAKIITAVTFFGEPAPEELESFFSGEINCAQLQDIIVNLEERFILYRFSDEKTVRLALNPVLEKVLLPFTADVSTLFPAVSPAETLTGTDTVTAPKPPQAAVLDDRILAGLFSFVSAGEYFFKAENIIRKKVIEAGKVCFPGIELPLVLGSLQMLGLFYAEGDRLIPDKKRFEDFGELSPRERSEYCAAALLVYSESKTPSEILPPLFRNKIREITKFIHHFLDSLEAELLYPEKSLTRLTEILKAKTDAAITSSAMLEVMEKTGLIVTVSPELRQLGAVVKNTAEKHNEPVIAVDSGFTILVYPEINYTDVLSLASAMAIREAGPVVRFELDRDSAVRAFDRNIGADEIIELLQRLSGFKIDNNFIWTLKDWENRHREVSLKKGVILTLAEDRRYLIETRRFASMNIETLAPGVYLLPENTTNEASAALQNAGIDIIARPCKNETYMPTSSNFPPPSNILSFGGHEAFASQLFLKKIPAASAEDLPKTEPLPDHATLTEDFHAILKEMPLDKTAQAELAARINRRLILCGAQLKEAYVRYEKLEARLLDYAGKQNIAKQAIAQQSPLELVLLGGEKAEKRIFGIPKALEKDGGELVLVIIPAEGQENMRIPLGKVSLLRRIKKSIFT